VPSTVNVYVPRAGLPTPLGPADGLDGLVGVGAGPGPEAARVVVVAAAALVVTVVELAALRVVPVVADDAVDPGTAMGGAAVVPVVSAVGRPEVVVLLGGPAMANWPPRRNEGGPLWVIL
jgi:hypothetical protein